MADDFGMLGAEKKGAEGKGIKRPAPDSGEQRPWLRVFETLPPQLLNAYGEAKFGKLSDAAVWVQLCKPLKSGAMYCTEFASKDVERRGIAINRWLQVLIAYCEYQKKENVKKQNEFIMEAVFKEFYDEVDRILPRLTYCLAPKKVSEKSGAASLRSNATESSRASDKTEAELNRHAKVLWEWLDVKVISRIRMMMAWQAASGVSFVAHVHHRAAQCFKYYGNSAGDGAPGPVTLEEFQLGIKNRHEAGARGIEGGDAGLNDCA